MDIVINTFGVSISREGNGFLINNAEGKQRVPSVGVRSITIGKGAQITSDAILLAVENEIEVLFSDREGTPKARIWSPKYGSISSIRKGQLEFCSSEKAVQWIKEIIRQKIENQQAVLLMMPAEILEEKNLIQKSIARLEDYRRKIDTLQGQRVTDISTTLRGWEGISSKIYFDTMNVFLPAEYQFEKRTQHPAMDVANAMLNYGYGILYSKIEGSLIRAGIDPYIGVMHRDSYNRPVLVYDIIELYRVWVDYVVFSLLTNYVISDEHYSTKEDGSYWLEALGRRILIQSLNDFLEEIVDNSGLSRSRSTQIFIYCQDLAQMFKKYN